MIRARNAYPALFSRAIECVCLALALCVALGLRGTSLDRKVAVRCAALDVTISPPLDVGIPQRDDGQHDR